MFVRNNSFIKEWSSRAANRDRAPGSKLVLSRGQPPSRGSRVSHSEADSGGAIVLQVHATFA